jgi:hypothetical protein
VPVFGFCWGGHNAQGDTQKENAVRLEGLCAFLEEGTEKRVGHSLLAPFTLTQPFRELNSIRN